MLAAAGYTPVMSPLSVTMPMHYVAGNLQEVRIGLSPNGIAPDTPLRWIAHGFTDTARYNVTAHRRHQCYWRHLEGTVREGAAASLQTSRCGSCGLQVSEHGNDRAWSKLTKIDQVSTSKVVNNIFGCFDCGVGHT